MGVSCLPANGKRMDRILQRCGRTGRYSQSINYLNGPGRRSNRPTPILPVEHLRKTFQALPASMPPGWPYQCSFCTIINVRQGRKSRRAAVRRTTSSD